MAAATVDIPAIALSVGPMLNGWHKGQRAGSGTIIWAGRQQLAAGEIDYEGFMDMASASAPSVGYCNTMGTASTMNSLAEALDMQLPGSAAIPAPYRERGQMAYLTGRRIVDMVREDLKPSDIMTRASFENAIVVNSAIGGSTNAPIHLNAIARHLGLELTNDDWQRFGLHIPLLVDLQPAGRFLGEDFHRAGGVPGVIAELMAAGALPNPQALTVSGLTIAEAYATAQVDDPEVIRPFAQPLKPAAGFLNLKGNLFDSAIMKTSVIAAEFRDRYLSNPDDPDAFEGRAIVFEGPEDYHHRIDDPKMKIDANTMLLVSTDRLSAFDVILPTGITNKGAMLTQMANFWFEKLQHVVPNHLTGIDPASVVTDAAEKAQLANRSVVVKKLKALPIEAIVRGYLVGSGWKEYKAKGTVCEIPLPSGLQEASKLPQPLFTPSSKAAVGEHDENISIAQVDALIGKALAEQVAEVAIALYTKAAEYALTRGIIIADTKFEFGLDENGVLHVMDEVLTPDSSRFWPAESYAVGSNPPSYDKQYVRDWLEASGWNKTPPAPALPSIWWQPAAAGGACAARAGRQARSGTAAAAG